MRPILTLVLLLLIPLFSGAQSKIADSLKQRLQIETKDTSRVLLLNKLSHLYTTSRPDTAMVLAQQGLLLAKKTGFAKGEVGSLIIIGNVFQVTGNYPKALQVRLEALKKAEAIGEKKMAAIVLANIGVDYYSQGDYHPAIVYFRKSLVLAEHLQQTQIIIILSNLGASYLELNSLDSALIYTKQAYDLAVQQNDVDGKGVTLVNLGDIYTKKSEEAIAMSHYRLAVPLLIAEADDDALGEAYLGMATLFQKAGEGDSCLRYARQALSLAQKGGFTARVLKATRFLTTYYTAAHNVDSAFAYQSASLIVKDSLFSQEKQREFQRLAFDEVVRQQQILDAKEEVKTQWKFNMLFGGLFTLVVVAILLYRNNRQKQTANVLLIQQKAKVESALQELKATQAQLVQSEKMASLGQLTAGIAHEIQNPLNFVNNFSDVNQELLIELKEEADKGNIDEVKAIANDVINNEEKINHHGKRADAIVKGMLQHSRVSTGQKELTDVNALADEYLRLSYHGMRAKDKTFNATLQTDFDASIGKINVVPQDIGRVLLNLFNNAFYAVSEKKKVADEKYEPTVSVNTKKMGNKISISVKDNGNGIPQKVVDKIFQPFFTTKPTGQGTGLGLSLSYDIIKAHGGEIKVETKEREGSEFKMTLPINN